MDSTETDIKKERFSEKIQQSNRDWFPIFGESIVTLAAGIIGGAAALLLALYVQKKEQDVQQILLAQELSGTFYENKLFSEIRSAIDSCEILYISNGGTFSHDEINQYLGFYEDIGFFSNQKKFLDLDVVAHMFGAHLVEAHEYPELKIYIKGIRKNSSQPSAYKEFDELHEKIKELPEFSVLVDSLKDACT